MSVCLPNNEPLLLQALETLDKFMNNKLEVLSEITATPTSQLKFVTDAWYQVVDCRRMLKWTYAFGYYRFADDSATNKPQQEFFEFNQVSVAFEIVQKGVSGYVGWVPGVRGVQKSVKFGECSLFRHASRPLHAPSPCWKALYFFILLSNLTSS